MASELENAIKHGSEIMDLEETIDAGDVKVTITGHAEGWDVSLSDGRGWEVLLISDSALGALKKANKAIRARSLHLENR